MFKEEGNIIWLASYPKSGNTWLRIFLNNLLSEKNEPIDINVLNKTGSIASSRVIFDELVGVDSADLTSTEIDYYLPQVHLLRSKQLKKRDFIKIHDAFTKNQNDKWIIPLAATYKVIYLIRNPLDVAVSMAYYYGDDFDTSINDMSNPNLILGESKKRQLSQLHQYMGSWSDHVNSWINNVPPKKILVVRYEDMKLKTVETFSRITYFLDLPYSSKQIINAIDNSTINRLQAMEVKKGFKGNINPKVLFFRKGIVGGWREELSENQILKIIKAHKELMIQYNYWPLLNNSFWTPELDNKKDYERK